MEEKKNKTRIRRKNSGIKKLLFLLILLFIIIQLIIKVILPGSVSLSRYVYTAVKGFYLQSKSFYFNSDKLSTRNAYFESNNWSGVDEYKVTVNMNSRKNINEVSNVDINYNIEYEYAAYKEDGTLYQGDVIDFYLTGSEQVNNGAPISRTIFANSYSNNQDNFEFSIKPKTNVNLKNNDYVYVKIKATSTSPYVSTLTGEFKIIIGSLGMSYKIEDAPYDSYSEVIITNTLDYYIADQAVGGVQAGSQITIAKYLELSDEDKAKCHSMIIELEFDPEIVRLDTTSGIYMKANQSEVEYEVLGSNNSSYANKIRFKIGAEESVVVKFYKVDASKDYTYPNTVEGNSVVTVTSI